MFANLMRRLTGGLLLAAAVTLFSTAAPVKAVVNGTEPECNDRRFDGVGLLLRPANPLDLQLCWNFCSGAAVLIDEDLVMVTRHSILDTWNAQLPEPGARRIMVRFRRAPNGDAWNRYSKWGTPCHGTYTEVFIHEFYRPNFAGMDVLIGRLERPIRNVTPIQVETNPARMPRSGANIYIAGWGFQGPGFHVGEALQLMVGAGVLPTQANDGYTYSVNPCQVAQATGQPYNCPSGGPWALPNYLDSGAPLLFETGCIDPMSGRPMLRVAGIVTTVNAAWRTTTWNEYGTTPQLVSSSNPCHYCPADFNNDKEVTAGDLFEFLDAWFSGTCIANVQGPVGAPDADDVLAFLGNYFEGCSY